jgi:hypothetical protein
MMFWGSAWSAAGGLTMMIGTIALVALVVVGVVLLFRPVFGHPGGVPGHATRPDLMTKTR